MSYIFSAQERQLLRDAINQSTGLTPSQTSAPQTFTPKEKVVGTSGLGRKPRHWLSATPVIKALYLWADFAAIIFLNVYQ